MQVDKVEGCRKPILVETGSHNGRGDRVYLVFLVDLAVTTKSLLLIIEVCT